MLGRLVGAATAAAAAPKAEAAQRNERERADRVAGRRAIAAQGPGGAIRRPQVGQSLRSFWASWSHQLQKRRFSTAHGSFDSPSIGQQAADDVELLAAVAVVVDAVGLGAFDDRLVTGRGRTQTIALGNAHVRHCSGSAGDSRGDTVARTTTGVRTSASAGSAAQQRVDDSRIELRAAPRLDARAAPRRRDSGRSR